MATRTRSTPTAIDAAHLQATIRSMRDFGYVAVRALRGHLVVFSGDDGTPVARLTPHGAGQYGLSFHHHTGRWEPMPFAGGLDEMATTATTALAPYLERWDFHREISGSDY
ncbi:MAG: hypothetical protein ACREJC_06190 [Tepidisphaeraceae bacterium]